MSNSSRGGRRLPQGAGADPGAAMAMGRGLQALSPWQPAPCATTQGQFAGSARPLPRAPQDCRPGPCPNLPGRGAPAFTSALSWPHRAPEHAHSSASPPGQTIAPRVLRAAARAPVSILASVSTLLPPVAPLSGLCLPALRASLPGVPAPVDASKLLRGKCAQHRLPASFLNSLPGFWELGLCTNHGPR